MARDVEQRSDLIETATLPPVSAAVRVLIRRDREQVFDYFADLRNEPEYNGQVHDIVKVSPGPIGQGTTFEGVHRGLGRVSWQLIEYDRPRHVAIDGGVGAGSYRWVGDFEAGPDGTWMSGRMDWRPPLRWRRLGPVLQRILQWNADRSFRRMARVLEGTGTSWLRR